MDLLLVVLVAVVLRQCTGDTCVEPDCQNRHSSTTSRYKPSDITNIIELNEAVKLCPSEKPHLETEPQIWQDVTERKLKVFSAFYESRVEADGPSIRVIGTGWQSAYNDIGSFFCTLWYEEFEEGISIGPAIYKVIYPSTMHPDMWVSHFIICPLPKGYSEPPYGVSITAMPCSPPGNHLKVLNRDVVEKTDTHALCVSPIYGKFKNWTMVIENFEIHKLLGASEITTYNFSVNSMTDKVLKSYANDDEENVNIIQWSYPPLKSNVWCQRGALNDCLYRMGHKHKYVTITDMDEILVPRQAAVWPDLMTIIDTPARGIYMFQHAYFRRNYTGDEPYLMTQQSLWRTDEVTPKGKVRCKSMYKAEKAVSIDLHYHYVLVAGTEEYMVPPEEGILHHYRKDPMETFRKYPERFTYIEDTYMSQYGEALMEAVKQRIEKVDEGH